MLIDEIGLSSHITTFTLEKKKEKPSVQRYFKFYDNVL